MAASPLLQMPTVLRLPVLPRQCLHLGIGSGSTRLGSASGRPWGMLPHRPGRASGRLAQGARAITFGPLVDAGDRIAGLKLRLDVDRQPAAEKYRKSKLP